MSRVRTSVRPTGFSESVNTTSSASPRPPCDGTPTASVWPSPRQTTGPPCPYPLGRTAPDAIMKPVDAPSSWFSPSDLDETDYGDSNARKPRDDRGEFCQTPRQLLPWSLSSVLHCPSIGEHTNLCAASWLCW